MGIVTQLAKPNEKFMYGVVREGGWAQLDQFKLFVFDTGLLKHMAGIDNSATLFGCKENKNPL